MLGHDPIGKLIVLLFAGGVSLLSPHAEATDKCGLSQAFLQRDKDAKTGATAVWSDSASSALFFIESLNVNTDGTRKSYSVDDFWGEERALNNLCNAMSDACAGLSQEGKKNRRILTQQAYGKGWPKDELSSTKISPSIIPFKNGVPCPLVDGFLVSATALHKPNIQDVCDIDNYVDALTTSAIVIPKDAYRKDPLTKKMVKVPSEFSKRNAKVGDLVVAVVPGATTAYFAVVGDTGPVDSLGEASIALNGRLRGKTALPENYLEVRGKGKYEGNGWYVPKAVVLIFPGTGNSSAPYMVQNDIDVAAKSFFDKWGGIERLDACVAEYGRKK